MKGWLDKYQVGGEASKYIQNVPKTFGKGVTKTDATKVNKQVTPTTAKKVTQEQLDEREAQARRDRIVVSNAVQPYMLDSPKNFAVASSAIGDKLRVSEYPNVFDDYINPASMFGHLGSGLGQVPLNIQEGNYGQAAMNVANPVIAGAAEKLLAPVINKGVRSGRTAIDQNFTQVGKQLAEIEKIGINLGASPQQIKNWQMQDVGITSLQREGYVPGVSEVFSEYITPYSYDNPAKRILDIPRRIVTGEKNSKNLSDINVDFIFDGIEKGQVAKPRYDSWRMYSGLPQEYDTFRIAETRPINHPNYSDEQLANLEIFSLNDEKKLLRDLPSEYDADLGYLENSELVEALPELKNKLKQIQELKSKGIDVGQSDFTSTGVMGGYNRRFFNNKMEYNDIWDLVLGKTKVDKYFGKPFMSHGQLDYSFQPAEDALQRTIRAGEYYQGLGDNIKKPKVEFFDAGKKINNLKQFNSKDITVNKKENGGWLEKYNDGGPVQPNYNDYSVSASPDFVGEGYSNVGRNYSPAWGGQFQMGGSLPGATGFMYARAGAPSNGKYAKKTKASAQNGAEMKFYQEGLDFKPKSISKNGSKVIKDDRGQWDHPGEITEIGSNQITMQGVPYPVMGISDTGDTQMMYPNEEYEFIGDSVTEYPMMQNGGWLDSLVDVGKSAVNYIGGLFEDPAPVVKPKASIKPKADTYDTMLDLGFNNPQSAKLKNLYKTNRNKVYLEDKNKVELNTGRFKGANVSAALIDDIALAAKRNKIPVGQLLALAGRESTFGQQKGNDRAKKDSANNEYMSGWNVAEDYSPYDPHRFLADKKVPGIKTLKNSSGYYYEITDEKAAREYLKKNPQLLDQYKKKLATTPDIGNRNYFDLSAEFLKKKGIQGYNPGDPTYVEMFNQDYNTLKQDKELMSYLKKKGYKYKQGGQLTKLDQLTNFTNYNTKQPGGWLDKYQ